VSAAEAHDAAVAPDVPPSGVSDAGLRLFLG
jgi:hypothetical protein